MILQKYWKRVVWSARICLENTGKIQLPIFVILVSCGDLVHWAGGGVSHVAEDGEDHTSAEDAEESKSR